MNKYILFKVAEHLSFLTLDITHSLILQLLVHLTRLDWFSHCIILHNNVRAVFSQDKTAMELMIYSSKWDK